VQLCRFNFQDPVESIRSHPTCLLYNKSHRVALVKQTELAFWRTGSRRVDIDAPLDQVTVNVCHHGTNVPGGIRPVGRFVFDLGVFEIFLYALREMHIITFIDRIDIAVGRNFHVRMRQTKLSYRRIQRKSIDSFARSINQHCRRTIDHITRSYLLRAFLQHIFKGSAAPHRFSPVDRKDGAYRNIAIDIRGAVERIDTNNIFGIFGYRGIDDHQVIFFFGSHDAALAATGQRTDELRVGKYIQLLLTLALDAGVLAYKSVYMPDSNAFDTFSKDYSTTKLPVYERQIPKAGFSEKILPTDVLEGGFGWLMPSLWNNTYTGNGFATEPGKPLPVWFTFDMGVSAKINRFLFWMPEDRIFDLESVKTFEIWGSNESAADGSWDSWTLLRTCQSIKPSGSPLGTNTDEDVAAAAAGQEFVMPAGVPKVRYIRIKVLSNWGDGSFQAIGEFTFFSKER
jgi:hypothetical protein